MYKIKFQNIKDFQNDTYFSTHSGQIFLFKKKLISGSRKKKIFRYEIFDTNTGQMFGIDGFLNIFTEKAEINTDKFAS